MNEVLVYGPIWSESARLFVQSFNELESDSVVCRINTNGGNPEDGWSMITKFNEFEGQKNVKVDGKAYSMGAFFCLYADVVECVDVSQFMFHRAAYSPWYESEYMTDAEKSNLLLINKKLREAFEAKIDVAKFEGLKYCKDNSITVDRLFSMDERVDVFLSASEAKKIGLVNKVNQLTPQKATAINTRLAGIKSVAASAENQDLFVKVPIVKNPTAETNEKPENVNNQNKNKMTVADFKAQFPEAYNSIVKEGADNERNRVGAWMAFHEIDAKAVQEGINSGATISQKEIAEFTVTAMKNGFASTLKAEGDESKEEGKENGTEAKVTVPNTPSVDAVAKLTNQILGKTTETK